MDSFATGNKLNKLSKIYYTKDGNMSNNILVLSTTPGMSKCCRNVFKSRGYNNIPIYDVTASQSINLVNEHIKKGTKVVISRGGTANYLRDFLKIPVVDVRHSFLSVFLAVNSLSKKYKNIALIGFEQNCETAQRYNVLVKDILRIYEVNKHTQYSAAFHLAIKNGADVIIGGFQVKNLCEIFNMDYYSLKPDETEVIQALNEALHSLYIEEEQLKQYNLINTILNSTSEGIVGIDKSGIIIHINDIASKILKCNKGEQIENFIPSNINLHITQNRNDFYNKVFAVDDVSIVISCKPIIIKNEIDGAVLTIHEEDTIRIIDNKIRKRKLGHGHFAKKTFNDVLGSTKVIKDTIKTAKRYAISDSTILVSGETGTGKELFVQSIHNYSKRKNNPFIAVNCAALPQNLLESELFGYVKGAFTGARSGGKAGIFELAHGGTVFLDEISEMTTEMQVKVLRVLQEQEVMRIGDERVTPIDVRIIAACNKDLKKEVALGNFREDLYYRICVLELHIPPLRERTGDILELINYFMANHKQFTSQALNLMNNYNWPGNIRQLFNIVERLKVLCAKNLISELDVYKVLNLHDSKEIQKELSNHESPNANLIKNRKVNDMEKDLIINALIQTKGNRSQATKLLGISRTSLWRKVNKYEIDL